MPCIENDCFSTDSLGSQFTNLKVIAGGAHGCVYSAVDRNSSESSSVALKRLSLKSRSHCRVALREIRLARRLRHDNVVKILKVTDKNGKDIGSSSLHERERLDSVYVVQELMDTDLHNVLDKSGKLPEDVSRIMLYQLLRGLKYIHSCNVVHRDIKPGNLLVNLDDFTLKVADFGLARVCDPRYDHIGHLTELVTTRYYRAPEVILEPGNYASAVDLWSAGCVFAEMLTGDVMFCGENDLQQADVILSAFGMASTGKLQSMSGNFPTEQFDGISHLAVDLLQKLLCLDPEKRPTAEQAMAHPFFGELRDPSDEPSCNDPFLIEHEVDDLSLNTLKRRIVATCQHLSEKVRETQADVLFLDFDEVISQEEPNSQMDVESSPFSSASTSKEATQNDFTSLDSCLQVPSIPAAWSENNNCPSLSNVMTYDPMDEPCRDPGLFGSTEGYLSTVNSPESPTETRHCAASYKRVSPMMDYRPFAPLAKEAKLIESVEDMSLMEAKVTKHALNQYRTLCGRNVVSGCQSTGIFDRSCDFGRLDSTGHIDSLNKKLVQQIGSYSQCRMADLVGSKYLSFDTLGLNRLEPLRFWM